MENMVNVYFYGKHYVVPAELTIMTAMEYAGYELKRGCGCRHGLCGACAPIYRPGTGGYVCSLHPLLPHRQADIRN